MYLQLVSEFEIRIIAFTFYAMVKTVIGAPDLRIKSKHEVGKSIEYCLNINNYTYTYTQVLSTEHIYMQYV